MMDETVLLEEFEAAIDEYGPDLADWPDDLRARGRTLLAASPEARELLESEKRLEAAFAAAPAIRAPSSLTERILQAAALDAEPATPTKELQSSWHRFFRHLPVPPVANLQLRYAFVLALCFALGLVGGQLTTFRSDETVAPYMASLYADLAY